MKEVKMPGTLKESYEQRNTVNTLLKGFQQDVKDKKLDLNDPVKATELDDLLDENRKLSEHIQRLESLEKAQKEAVNFEEEKEPEKPKRTADQVFERYIRFKIIDPEDRATMSELAAKGSEMMHGIRAATDPQGTTDAVGGYLIPTGFQAQLDQAMLAYFTQLEACTVLPTSMGNDLHWPTVNDTSNTGHLLTEHTQDTVLKVDFSEVIFYAYMFTSYIVKVSLQLLQDSAIPVEPVLSNILGERLGRVLATYMTTGTGSSQPHGIATAATDAALSAVGATAITRNNVLDLIYSVDPAYRNAPGAALMMHDSTLKAIAKLTIGTADDRPLWQPSIITGQPDTIEGKRFYINMQMEEIGASNASVLFGDLKKFVIRRVLGTTLFTYREKYMDYLQVAFQAYNRWDSRLLDAGTHPIKKMVHAAS